MRKETQPAKLCAYCKLPITDEQRPSVKLRNGKEIHIECHTKYERGARKPN